MNKTLSVILIIWMLLSIVENILNIQQNKEHVQRQEVLDQRHQQLDNRLKVYEDLADPKTTQFYIHELEKIVDNMHRLGKIIDEGGEIDIDIARIEKQYHILNDKLLSTTEAMSDIENDVTKNLEQQNVIALKDKEDIKTITDEKIADLNISLQKHIDMMLNDIQDIKNTLTQLENSKIGKKIFN
tara:strand:- start:101 stop:655 length:555 start_codon:yes stop_codon:yes gene_type:complete